MKAMRIHDYGSSDSFRLEEIPKPEPKDNEVLIKVRASSVNPVDWKLRGGFVRQRFDLPMPCILGADVAGVIERVGSAVSGFSESDEVFAMVGLMGAYCEYVAVPEAMVALKPKSMTFVEAATVPLAALTAWQGLVDHGHIRDGQTVLVSGAAGGVGSFATQIAKAKGAFVIATASEKNSEYVTSLGADEVIDFRQGDMPSRQVDLAIDMLGGESASSSLAALNRGGILVQVAPGLSETDQTLAAEKSITVTPFQVKPDGAQLSEIAGLIDQGAIKTRVDAVFPLEEIGKAQDLSAGGRVTGKIAITLE